MKKIFISSDRIKDNTIIIDGSDFHHLKNVLRKNLGDLVDISDGALVYKTEVIKIDDKKIYLKIIEKSFIEENSIKIRLFQSIPKGKVIEDILIRTTEIGVWEFYPVISERTIFKIDKNEVKKKIERWKRISLETAKKVGIASPLIIKEIIELKQIKNYIKDDELKIVFWENEEKNNIKNLPKDKNHILNVVIGPEGGLSYQEVDFLVKNGFTSLSLGKRIYTVETATIVAISNLLFYYEN